jgi:hypothetical protein
LNVNLTASWRNLRRFAARCADRVRREVPLLVQIEAHDAQTSDVVVLKVPVPTDHLRGWTVIVVPVRGSNVAALRALLRVMAIGIVLAPSLPDHVARDLTGLHRKVGPVVRDRRGLMEMVLVVLSPLWTVHEGKVDRVKNVDHTRKIAREVMTVPVKEIVRTGEIVPTAKTVRASRGVFAKTLALGPTANAREMTVRKRLRQVTN